MAGKKPHSKLISMKYIKTILFFLFWVSAVSQSQTTGYVLQNANGTINLPDASINISKVSGLDSVLNTKQAALASGTNIKTVNGNSLLGSGDIAIAGGEAFPVGSIFISAVSTNPATLLGYGTWVAFGAGRVLVGIDAGDADFDVVEETGGSKTKTITAGNLPELSVAVTDPGHTHLTQRYPTATGGSSGFTIDVSMSGTIADNTLPVKSNTTGITATANTGGANTPVSVVQPYITVYMWKRTS